MQKLTYFLAALLSGLLNGLFASGGGIPAVACFKKKGLKQKNAQATALCVTFLLSLISLLYYYYKGFLNIQDALIYIPFGIPGALLGSFLLKKAPDKILRKVFSLFIIWAGVRMLF